MVSIAIFLIIDTSSNIHRLNGLMGMAFLVLIMITFSYKPSKVFIFINMCKNLKNSMRQY